MARQDAPGLELAILPAVAGDEREVIARPIDSVEGQRDAHECRRLSRERIAKGEEAIAHRRVSLGIASVQRLSPEDCSRLVGTPFDVPRARAHGVEVNWYLIGERQVGDLADHLSGRRPDLDATWKAIDRHRVSERP